MKMTQRRKASLIRRNNRIAERTKALYVKRDAITTELLAALTPGEQIAVDGKTFTLQDNFADRNVVYRPTGVKRFEIVEVKPLPVRPKKKEMPAGVEPAEVAEHAEAA